MFPDIVLGIKNKAQERLQNTVVRQGISCDTIQISVNAWQIPILYCTYASAMVSKVENESKLIRGGKTEINSSKPRAMTGKNWTNSFLLAEVKPSMPATILSWSCLGSNDNFKNVLRCASRVYTDEHNLVLKVINAFWLSNHYTHLSELPLKMKEI